MMRYTEKWLSRSAEQLAEKSGIKMWDTHVAVDRYGVLSFCQTPGSVIKQDAKLIVASNEDGFGITLLSSALFTGLQTHYERPVEKVIFNTISVSDIYPDTATLYGPTYEGPLAELLVEPADIVAWTLCKMVNQKAAQQK